MSLMSILCLYYITYFQKKYYLSQLESCDDAQLIVLPVKINHTHRLSDQRVNTIGAHLEYIQRFIYSNSLLGLLDQPEDIANNTHCNRRARRKFTSVYENNVSICFRFQRKCHRSSELSGFVLHLFLVINAASFIYKSADSIYKRMLFTYSNITVKYFRKPYLKNLKPLSC